MPPIVANLVLPMIITIVLIAVYVTLSTVLLKNANEHKKLLPVRIIFYLMIIFEVAKIVYLIGKDGFFFANRFPIVFCSMSMFAFPLFCFKQNRFSDVAKGFCVIPGILAFVMFAAIQYRYSFSIMQAHSYFYHGAMLAVAIYLLTSKLYKFEFKKFYGQFLTVSGYIVSASLISYFIGGSISVFGPKDPYCAFLYNISGFMVGIMAIVVALFVAYFAVYGIIALCQRALKKKNEKKNEISAEKTKEAK